MVLVSVFMGADVVVGVSNSIPTISAIQALVTKHQGQWAKDVARRWAQVWVWTRMQ